MVAVFVPFNNDMFWGWGEAVLNSAIATDALLVSAGIEKAKIKWIVGVVFGQVNGIYVLLRVVVIVAVASDST